MALHRGYEEGRRTPVLHPGYEVEESGEGVKLMARSKGGSASTFYARYLVGADGASSRIRGLCYPGWRSKSILVVQEMWRCRGDFDDCFYMMLLDPEITPTYGYVVPKGAGLHLIGVGVPPGQRSGVLEYLEGFKRWLEGNMGFEPLGLIRREVGRIPLDEPWVGRGNIILVGDAAGLNDSFTGRGFGRPSGAALWPLRLSGRRRLEVEPWLRSLGSLFVEMSWLLRGVGVIPYGR